MKNRNEPVYVVIMGQRMAVGELLKLGAIVFGFLVAVGVAVGLVFMAKSSGERTEDGRSGLTGTPQSFEEPSDISPTLKLLLLHQNAMGNEPVDTLSARGTYQTSGLDLVMEMHAKKPGLLRQVLRVDTLRIVSGYDGRRFWQDNPLVGEKGFSGESAGIARDLFKLEANPLSLVWEFESEGTRRLSLVGRERFEGKDCVVVRNTGLISVPIDHLLDPDTGIELARRCTLPSKNADLEVRLVYHYGIPIDTTETLPVGYTLKVQEKTVAEAKFTEWNRNIGLISVLFEETE